MAQLSPSLSSTIFCKELLKEDGILELAGDRVDTSIEEFVSDKDKLHSTAVYYDVSFLKSGLDPGVDPGFFCGGGALEKIGKIF